MTTERVVSQIFLFILPSLFWFLIVLVVTIAINCNLRLSKLARNLDKSQYILTSGHFFCKLIYERYRLDILSWACKYKLTYIFHWVNYIFYPQMPCQVFCGPYFHWTDYKSLSSPSLPNSVLAFLPLTQLSVFNFEIYRVM